MSFKKIQFENSKQNNYINHSAIDFKEYPMNDLKVLWKNTLKQGMHGICFSMYEDGQKPGDIITEAQVERRISILKPYSKWVRSFSCTEGNEHVPRIAHKHGMKTMVGAWLGDDKDNNDVEIEALISLANDGVVDIAAVGNEVLYRNDLSLEELLDCIKKVKRSIPDHIPVDYVDAYYEFSLHPELVDISDVILSNCYPFWEGTHIDDSLVHMQQMISQVEAISKGKQIIITETGWPSSGGNFKDASSSDENAMKYFIDTQLWTKNANIDMFYFSSFDESWKTGDEGDVGAYWGIWDKKEVLKF